MLYRKKYSDCRLFWIVNPINNHTKELYLVWLFDKNRFGIRKYFVYKNNARKPPFTDIIRIYDIDERDRVRFTEEGISIAVETK
jgi:hypothetical protein